MKGRRNLLYIELATSEVIRNYEEQLVCNFEMSFRMRSIETHLQPTTRCTSTEFLGSMNPTTSQSSENTSFQNNPRRNAVMFDINDLPIVALQHILTFVDESYIVNVVPQAPQLSVSLFQTLANVSSQWRSAIYQLERIHHQTSISIHITTDQEKNNYEVEHKLQPTRHHIRALALTIDTSEFIANFEIQQAKEAERHLNTLFIDWEEIFSACPRLQRLDLSRVSMHSIHLKHILDAASTYCTQLQALILPCKEWHHGTVKMDWMPTMNMLITALERWYCNGPNRGLRQLTVPRRITSPDSTTTLDELTDKYLLAIAAYCPEIEYFDGWKFSYTEEEHQIICDELLFGSLAAWHTFCLSCTRLREINWFVLPFIDDFFNSFAVTPKPLVEKLTLASGDHYNFQNDEVLGSYYQDGNWNYSTDGLIKVVQACPNLRNLRVVFQYAAFEDPVRQLTMTDSFLVAVSRRCKDLRRFEIVELNHPDFCDTIDTITDVGITAIASLPELRYIELKATRCEAQGIVSLMKHSPTEGAPRIVEMVIGCTEESVNGDSASKAPAGFYDILSQVLNIVTQDLEAVSKRRFQITLTGSIRGDHKCDDITKQSIAVARKRLGAYNLSMLMNVVENYGRATVILTTGECNFPAPRYYTMLEENSITSYAAPLLGFGMLLGVIAPFIMNGGIDAD